MNDLDERFADWVDGRLKPAERAALEAELARDPELARAAEEYRRTVQMVRGALSPEPMPGSVADAVLRQVAPARPRPWRIRPYFASAAAAAALLLAFLVARQIPPVAAPAAETGVAKADADRNALRDLVPVDKSPAPETSDDPARSGAGAPLPTRGAAGDDQEAQGVAAARPGAAKDSRGTAGLPATEQSVEAGQESAEQKRGIADARERQAAGGEALARLQRVEQEARNLLSMDLGELTVVVEPQAGDALAQDPRTFLAGLIQAGAPASGPEVELRDVEPSMAKRAEARAEYYRGAEPERSFVVRGTPEAVRAFVARLQVAVTEAKGTVRTERVPAPPDAGADAFFLGGGRRTAEPPRAGGGAGSAGRAGPASAGPASPGPAGPATPGAKAAQPGPAPTEPTKAPPTPIELRLRVRLPRR